MSNRVSKGIYSWDSRIDQNAVQEWGKQKLYWRDPRFDCSPGSGPCQNLGMECGIHHAIILSSFTILKYKKLFFCGSLNVCINSKHQSKGSFISFCGKSFKCIFLGKKNRIRDTGYRWKMCRMQDSHENEVGMRGQDPRPFFQTLIKHSRPLTIILFPNTLKFVMSYFQLSSQCFILLLTS